MKIHLVFGLITVVLLVIVISSRQRETVGFDEVAAAALKMAQEDYLTASPPCRAVCGSSPPISTS